MNVLTRKQKVPILAARKKKKLTIVMERKISIQDSGSNSFVRFQVGATFDGYLENQ